MANNKRKKKIEQKKPFEGSIKAKMHSIFEEPYTPKKGYWKYKALKGELNHTCINKQLTKLFNLLHVDFKIDKRSDIGLKDSIEGLPIDRIKYDGDHHVRLYFNGITQTDFDQKRAIIESFLTKLQIPFENYCLYICVTTGKQAELTSEYMRKWEKLA